MDAIEQARLDELARIEAEKEAERERRKRRRRRIKKGLDPDLNSSQDALSEIEVVAEGEVSVAKDEAVCFMDDHTRDSYIDEDITLVAGVNNSDIKFER